MENNKIKNAVEDIQISQEMKEQLMNNCYFNKNRGDVLFRYSKVFALFLAIGILAVGSLGVGASVSLIQKRMQSISREEKKQYSDFMEHCENGQIYSREFTKEESKQLRVLEREYQKGVFPKKSIQTVNKKDEIKGNEVYYVLASSRFHLPETTLTKEQMLELIDSYYKRDYVFSETNTEINQEMAKQGEEIENIAQDSIDKDQGKSRKEILIQSKKDVLKFFPKAELEGMSSNITPQRDGNETGNTYEVEYELPGPEFEAYYFVYQAATGELISATHSSDSIVYKKYSKEEMLKNLNTRKEDSLTLLKEQIDCDVDNAQVYYRYETDSNNDAKSNMISCYCLLKDGQQYCVTWIASTGELTGFKKLYGSDQLDHDNRGVSSAYTLIK